MEKILKSLYINKQYEKMTSYLSEQEKNFNNKTS